jgi:ribosomal protein S18 acetylase RimI-like enzyme
MQDRELKKLTTQANKLWVAETNDGHICGIVTTTKRDNDTFSLNKLSVRSGFRRHGVGRRLVEKVIENCQKMKSKKLILSTTNTRKNARRLYLSLGFVETKTYRTPIGLIQYLPMIFTGVYSIQYDLMFDV